MKPDHLAAIWVVVDNDHEEFLTGYPIAPNRILTAAHPLKNGYKEILVWFSKLMKEPVKAIVVWNGREKSQDGLDAMVLALELESDFPNSINESLQFLEEPPKQPVKWFSNCYPKFARDGGSPKDGYLDARGEFNPPPSGVTFTLECDEKNPDPTEWGGASGAPIFVEATLAGIISNITLKVGKGRAKTKRFERLNGVPVWELIKSEGFLASLGSIDQKTFDDSESAWRKRLPNMIRMELKAIGDLYASDRLEFYFQTPIISNPSSIEKLVDLLVADPKKVHKVSKVREECRAKGLDDAADRLEQIENHLLPRLFDINERKRFWSALKYQGAILVGQAATCSASAEFRMASFDGNSVDLIHSNPEENMASWKGRHSLRVATVSPGDLSPEHIAFRILLELSGQKLEAEHLTVTAEARNQITLGIADENLRKSVLEDATQLVLRLNAHLETLLHTYDRTPYCIVRIQDTGLSREKLQQALAILRRWELKLDFLEIANDSPNGHHETPMLTLLSTRRKT